MTRPNYFDEPRWTEPGRAHRARRRLHRAGLYPWWDRYLARKIDAYNAYRRRTASPPEPRPPVPYPVAGPEHIPVGMGDYRRSVLSPVRPTPDPPGIPHPTQPTMNLLDPNPLGTLRRRRRRFVTRVENEGDAIAAARYRRMLADVNCACCEGTGEQHPPGGVTVPPACRECFGDDLDQVDHELMAQVVAPADLLVVDERMMETIGGGPRRTLLGLLRDRQGGAKAPGNDRPNPSGSGYA